MGQTHTLNSNQTPGPLNAANKTYRMPPYLGCLDSDSSTAITPDIGPESEHEMDSELELPRPLNSAETTTRRRRPSDTIGDMYTVAEGSSDGSSSLTHSSEKLEALEASGINEVFAKRREKMYCLAERVQGMSPRAYRHPQSRTRREVRARDQDVDVDVANKHARDSGHGSNTKCRTIKENFGMSSLEALEGFMYQANKSYYASYCCRRWHHPLVPHRGHRYWIHLLNENVCPINYP